jgi:hypothetical protein
VDFESPATLAWFWGLGDVGFTRADLAAARTVTARLAVAGRLPEVVVAAGDRALGLGQVSSSIHLYVVGDLPPNTERVVDVADTRVEISVLSACDAEELLALTTEYRATSRRSPQLAIGSDRLRDLIGLVTGWRLVTGPRWQPWFDAVDPDAVRQMVISRAALGFATAAEDTFAALLSGDLSTAVCLSVQALLFGCEAVLAAAGDLAIDSRFVFRRLARTPATESWCGRLWQLCNSMFPVDTTPEPALVRAVVEERLLVGNLLLSWCAVEGWAKPLTGLPESASLLMPMGVAGLRRSAYFAPVRFADDWTLFGPTRAYQTTETVVRLWRRLVGRQPDEAVHDLVGTEPELAGLPITDVNAALTTLHRIGAVEAPVSRYGQEWPGLSAQPAISPALSIVPAARFR